MNKSYFEVKLCWICFCYNLYDEQGYNRNKNFKVILGKKLRIKNKKRRRDSILGRFGKPNLLIETKKKEINYFRE